MMERREGKSADDLWHLLSEMKDQLDDHTNKLQNHIEDEAQYKPKLLELITILERSKGVVTFLRFSVYAGGLIMAISYWVKDHVKW